jgi:hypothetical protein
MKKILIITIFFFSICVSAQNSKYSLKYNYGLNIALNPELIGVCMDCNANTIGTVGNLEFEYKISTSESIGFGVTMTKNKNQNEYIREFSSNYDLRRKSTFFELYYKKDVLDTKKFFIIGGIGLLDIYSEIVKNHTHSNDKLLSEPGITFGVEYYLFKKVKFEFGIHSKIYWTPFNDGIQNIGIAPIVKYNF